MLSHHIVSIEPTNCQPYYLIEDSKMIEAKSNTTPSYSKASTSVSNQEVEDLEHELPVPPFDPAIHLNFQPPAKRYTFTELGLPVPKGVPDLCYTEPFQLFSEEGIRMLRREIFRRSFLDKYMRSWERAPCIITGFSLCDEVRGTPLLLPLLNRDE